MITVPRTDNSLLGHWWWTVDRWLLVALMLLACLGALMVLAASPAVATRLGLDGFYFVHRHLAFLALAGAVMFAVSLMSPARARRLSLIVLLAGLVLMALTLLSGAEIKGARRWLSVAGVSVQASEFVKPAFVVTVAWLFARQREHGRPPGDLAAVGLLVVVVGLLVLQPDFGMAVAVTAVWLAQFVMAGVSLVWIALLAGLGVAGLVAGYMFLPHVRIRIDHYLDPASGDSYQVDASLSAFSNGGLLGRGPGEGVVKNALPDAHADFIFAVVGEEFGLIACLIILALFAFVVLRGFARLMQQENLFVMLAAGGLLTQFGLQAAINMAVTLRLVPTKGMTLPFISYGGSSMLALALTMGMVIGLTRRRADAGRAL